MRMSERTMRRRRAAISKLLPLSMMCRTSLPVIVPLMLIGPVMQYSSGFNYMACLFLFEIELYTPGERAALPLVDFAVRSKDEFGGEFALKVASWGGELFAAIHYGLAGCHAGTGG
jgi:hypothetical protein